MHIKTDEVYDRSDTGLGNKNCRNCERKYFKPDSHGSPFYVQLRFLIHLFKKIQVNQFDSLTFSKNNMLIVKYKLKD